RALSWHVPGGPRDRRAERARPGADRRRPADPHERSPRGDSVHAAGLPGACALARGARHAPRLRVGAGRPLRGPRGLPAAGTLVRAADPVAGARMRFAHAMPFGAELRDDGVRFRLWAPAARRVEVIVEHAQRNGAPEALPMAAHDGGFHELVTQRAGAGTRYRYRIDGNIEVADPASRANPDDVHGASEVVDPRAFEWDEGEWRGRPWHGAVVYERQVGTFTPEGTFRAAIDRLASLAALGVTAIELMPVADFSGRRGWGYDGVLAFAPEESYGSPEDLKALVQAAHRERLMVLLDVVYNHFGPEGNYLHAYAPAFFNGHRRTLWGAAINFDGEGSRVVR